jgi:hypothetical protein
MLQSLPEAALRRIGVIEDVVVLGEIPEPAARHLGVATDERTVWLHPNTAHHIYTRRGFEDGEAAFVFRHLPRVIYEPHFCGCDPRTCGRLDLVHVTEDDARAVFAALKVVSGASAPSGRDEIWVSTAHRLPTNFLSRKRYRDSLQPLGGLDVGAEG